MGLPSYSAGQTFDWPYSAVARTSERPYFRGDQTLMALLRPYSPPYLVGHPSEASLRPVVRVRSSVLPVSRRLSRERMWSSQESYSSHSQ